MNILLVSRGYPSEKEPHRGCFEKDQAEALKALGHDVRVISLDFRFRFIWRKIGITHKIINDIHYYDFFLIPGIILKNIVGVKLFTKIRSNMMLRVSKKVIDHNWKPDVIYSHYFWNTLDAIKIKSSLNIPLVAMEHAGRFLGDSLNKKDEIDGKKAFYGADQLLTVSDFLRDKIENRFKVRSIVVPNMLGQEFLSGPKHVNNKKIIRFISIGSLVSIKQYEALIKAFGKCKLERDSWHLDIIGYGPLYKSLKSLIVNLNLQHNVTLLGPKSKEDILTYLSQSDIFVLVSRLETFGVVYIEALSQGLPCIATKCGGPTGIIDETNGLSIPTNDEEALIDSIHYMAKHYREYDKKLIRENCLKKYAPNNVAKLLESIFEQTIKKHKEKI